MSSSAVDSFMSALNSFWIDVALLLLVGTGVIDVLKHRARYRRAAARYVAALLLVLPSHLLWRMSHSMRLSTPLKAVVYFLGLTFASISAVLFYTAWVRSRRARPGVDWLRRLVVFSLCVLGIIALVAAVTLRPWATTYHKNLPHGRTVQDLQRAVRSDPTDWRAHYRLGVAYQGAGRFKEAAKAYGNAIRLNPRHADSYLGLCQTYNWLGQYDHALGACRRAVRLNPNGAETYVSLGETYVFLDRPRDAISAFRRAVRLNSDLASAHYGLAVSYAHLRLWPQARDEYDKTIQLDRTKAEAHLGLGEAYLMLGDREHALREYTLLKANRPDLARELEFRRNTP
jgi:cytochrome c-type biogenesis protein CcmH/NrfG